jgi:hypothetical protein
VGGFAGADLGNPIRKTSENMGISLCESARKVSVDGTMGLKLSIAGQWFSAEHFKRGHQVCTVEGRTGPSAIMKRADY